MLSSWLLVLAATTAMTGVGAILTRDLFRAGFLRPLPELCPARGEGTRLLVLVATAPGHAQRRHAIRLTWGHFLHRTDLAFAFMIGSTTETTALRDEQRVWGDLIVAKSPDGFPMLGLKTLHMLEWVLLHCPQVPRLLKTDDDVFVNMPYLLQFIVDTAGARGAVWGTVETGAKPAREHVPTSVYPFPMYPPHARGAAYLLTTDLVLPLLRAALGSPYVPHEAVFVTGFLARNVSAELVHVPGFTSYSPNDEDVLRLVSLHGLHGHRQLTCWRLLFEKLYDHVMTQDPDDIADPIIRETFI